MVAVKIDWVIDWDELNKAIVLIVGSEEPASLNITGADVDGLPDDCIIAAGSVLVTPTANYIAFEDGVFTEKSSSGGGGSSIEVESLTVTENDTYIAPEGKAYSPVTVNVPSSGGGPSLIATKSLGTITTSSTSETETGQTLVIDNADLEPYDLLIFETSADTTVDSGHLATVRAAYVIGASAGSYPTKSAGGLMMMCWNCQNSALGAYTFRNTTMYGIYPYTMSLDFSTQKWSIPIFMRYNSGETGTIDASYTMRVYGVNLYDLIGG